MRRFATDLAEQLARAGKPDEGLSVLAAEIDATHADRFWEAELFRVKGETLLRRGLTSDTVEAETCFHRALDIARQQHAKSFELRAAMSLARLWHAQARSQDAGSLLSGIYVWFTEGFRRPTSGRPGTSWR